MFSGLTEPDIKRAFAGLGMFGTAVRIQLCAILRLLF